jgi:hypothetical protein
MNVRFVEGYVVDLNDRFWPIAVTESHSAEVRLQGL